MDFKEEIAKLVYIDGINEDEIKEVIEKPKDLANGDFSIPCFKFSKKLGKSPMDIADSIIKNMKKNQIISKVENINGFLNFYINSQKIIDDAVNGILDSPDSYGSDKSGKNKTICIDFSSINIAKPFHIGHLLSTVIGAALCRVYRYLGYNVVGINHLGDWGTQFGTLITAYKKWGSEADVEKRGIQALMEYYVKFHKEEEKEQIKIAKEKGIVDADEIKKISTPLKEEARSWFKKIEEKDPEATAIFEGFKKKTLSEIKNTYDRLNVKFDSYNGESFYNDKMEPVVQELEEKKLLKRSQGALIVEFLDDEQNELMPPCLIKRSDGASLYITRDLAAAFYREKTYKFDKCLYVVAYQQNLHFKQLFEVIKMMGYKWSEKMEHVAFGMVSLESGSMSTRKGKVILLEDVLDTSVKKVSEIIKLKATEMKESDIKEISEQIGVGAVVFAALKNARIKDIVFSYDKILSFDGETGPYVQYTHVRCCSILRKADYIEGDDITTFPNLNNKEGRELCFKLAEFNDTLHQVIDKEEPSILSRYLLDISKLFNKFYNEHKIISENKEEQNERILLTMAVKEVIFSGMQLLGIECPSIM